LPIHPL
jgi:hypothetical protein